MKKLITAILLGLFLVAPVNAGPNNDITTLSLQERHNAVPVDRQTWCGDCPGVDFHLGSPWTVNPGWVPGYTPPIILPPGGGTAVQEGCMWDSDDYFHYGTYGNIMNPGAVLTATECRWEDSTRFASGGDLNMIRWYSSSPDLIIKYKFEWDTGSVTYIIPQPKKSTITTGNIWEYSDCFRAPPNRGSTSFPIPNSHDGRASYQLDTVTITNPTNKKVSKTGGFFTTDLRSYSLYCANGPSVVLDYP